MPAVVIPFRSRMGAGSASDSGSRVEVEFVILSLAPAGAPEIPFGVMILDTATREVSWKLREDALAISPEDAEYVAVLEDDFRAGAADLGGPQFLASFEDSLSGFLRMSARETATGSSCREILNHLFETHVVATVVQPFVTHLPFYPLRAAATRFGEDLEVEGDAEWVRAPEGLRISPEMFIVQVVGRSMEPLIPDGCLAVFRKFGAGSRHGKRLLIEELGVSGSSARFTVKRYTSVKRAVDGPEGEWFQESIRLSPGNPEFEAFELDAETFENRYRVIGEFVAVVPGSF